MKITDLLDDYYDDGAQLQERSDISAQNVLKLTEKKLGISRKKRFRMPKGVLIAAVLTLALSITAGAVGYTVWDAARKDAGLENGQSIPEYTEYHDSDQTVSAEATENLVDGAALQLVSTLGSGSDLNIYMTAAPVTQEQADQLSEKNQGLDTFAMWEISAVLDPPIELDGMICGAQQLEYDPETETALICGTIHGDFLAQVTELTVTVDYFYQSDGEADVTNYGSMTVPVTMSEKLVFQPEAALENSFVDAQGTVAEVTVYAGYISIQAAVEPFDDWCSRNGEDAWFRMGDAYWGYYDEAAGEARRTEYTEMDALVAYRRAWEVALNDLLSADSYLTLQDGSIVSLSDLQLISAEDDMEIGNYAEDFELPTAVNLAEIESLTLGGVNYFPAG